MAAIMQQVVDGGDSVETSLVSDNKLSETESRESASKFSKTNSALSMLDQQMSVEMREKLKLTTEQVDMTSQVCYQFHCYFKYMTP